MLRNGIGCGKIDGDLRLLDFVKQFGKVCTVIGTVLFVVRAVMGTRPAYSRCDQFVCRKSSNPIDLIQNQDFDRRKIGTLKRKSKFRGFRGR